MYPREHLLGAWRMTDWRVIADGRLDPVLPPLGEAADCGGMLLYTAEGLMSAMLSRSHRTCFADGSLDGGTLAQRSQAFQETIAYAGTFDYDEVSGEVTHVVEHATHPHLVGNRMKRICIFDGDRLRLDTPSMMMGGVARASYIDWQRCR